LPAFSIPKSNYSIIDSLVKESTQKIVDNLSDNSSKLFKLNINHHPAAWLVKELIIKEAAKRNIAFSTDDSLTSRVDISINDLRVSFDNFSEDDDSLIRKVSINLSGVVSSNNHQITPIPNFIFTYSDKVSRNDLPLIQSPQHDFANSQVPSVPKSFFREIAEPFIIISSAALVVILLFTVRSN